MPAPDRTIRIPGVLNWDPGAAISPRSVPADDDLTRPVATRPSGSVHEAVACMAPLRDAHARLTKCFGEANPPSVPVSPSVIKPGRIGNRTRPIACETVGGQRPWPESSPSQCRNIKTHPKQRVYSGVAGTPILQQRSGRSELRGKHRTAEVSNGSPTACAIRVPRRRTRETGVCQRIICWVQVRPRVRRIQAAQGAPAVQSRCRTWPWAGHGLRLRRWRWRSNYWRRWWRRGCWRRRWCRGRYGRRAGNGCRCAR